MPTTPTSDHGCGIPGCKARWTKGGVVGETPELARCPKHYHRERRAAAGAKPRRDAGGEELVPVQFRTPAHVDKALQRWHREEKKSAAARRSLPPSMSSLLSDLLERHLQFLKLLP